jgi:hypothetical protein
MMSGDTEASFTRVDTQAGAEFQITLAKRPGVSDVLKSTSMMGDSSIKVSWGPLLCLLAGLYLVFGTGGNIVAIIAGVGVIFLSVIWGRSSPPGSAKRKAKKDTKILVVNKAGITAEGQHFSSADIAELMLRVPGDVGSERSFAISSDYGHAHSQMQFNNLQSEIARRSLALMVRTRSSSDPVILVERLTPQVGQALLSDIMEIVRA